MESLTDDQRKLFSSSGSISDYKIIKPIGKGKFSVVYRAERMSDSKLVALKKLNIFDLMDSKAREKTLKEVRLVQSLRHKNIIQYIDTFFDESSELCILFEWAEAGDLKRQIRKANEKGAHFEERVIWKYFSQLCEAIRYMHVEKRTMHRDLKPANIFLTLQGVVKVGDLGLGRALSENTMEAHSKVGTPLYMSPEVLRGDAYDWKSDIWSLGCILYELANLKSPFKSEGLNLYGLFQKINAGDFKPLPSIYSETLRTLAVRMISNDPAARPDIEFVCNVAKEQCEATRRRSKSDENSRPSSSASSISRPASRESTASSVATSSRPTSRETTSLEFSPSFVLVASEMIRDLLIILKYDDITVMTHSLYFAIEAGDTRQNKFENFLQVGAWLLRTLGIEFDTGVSNSSPIAVATSLLSAVEKAGFDVADAANIPPTKLTVGFGAQVCRILLFLCEKAVKQSVDIKKPIYPVGGKNSEYDEEVQGDDQDEEEAFMEEEEIVYEAGPVKSKVEDNLQDSMIIAAVDKDAWKLECERVEPRLKAIRRRNNKTLSDSTWKEHVEAFAAYSNIVVSKRERPVLQLQHISKTIENDLESIGKIESRLESNFSLLQEEYARNAVASSEILATLTLTQERVNVETSRLSEISEELSCIKSDIDSHSSTVSDSAPLKRIKSALAVLKADVDEMNRKVSILSRQHWDRKEFSPLNPESDEDEEQVFGNQDD